MSQAGPFNLLNAETAVTSITGTAPIEANGVSGTPEVGNVTISLATPLVGQYGGTGITNSGLTISLASGGVGKVLASDSSGNATWQALSGIGVTSITGTANEVLVNGTSGTPTDGAITLTTPQPIGTGNSPTFVGLTLTGLTASEAVVTNGSDNLASLAYTAAPTASTIGSRDSNANTGYNNFYGSYAALPATGTYTFLSSGMPRTVEFSGGSGSATIKLPPASGLAAGWEFQLFNSASGTITVENSSGSTIFSMPSGSALLLLLQSTVSGIWDGHWLSSSSSIVSSAQGTAPITVNGTSGTPETGALTVALATPLVGAYGGTGIANTGLTINLASGANNLVMSSDSSGNATWGLEYTSSNVSSTLVYRDSNGNCHSNNFESATTGNAATGTITLTNASSYYQTFTSGSGSATVILPNATTINTGHSLELNNNASGNLTIQLSGTGTTFNTIPAGGITTYFCTSTSFQAGQWDYHSGIPTNSTWGTAGIVAPATASASFGSFLVTGTSSGTISILPQAAAGTYNFNLPTTAGTSGYLLTSAGGGSSAMTWSNPASIAVTSLTGTANQVLINATSGSAQTGACTVAFPATGGISIGSYQSTSPPTGGIICPGNVGIGNSSPGGILDVQGTNSVSGAVYGALFRSALTETGSGSASCMVFVGGTQTINGSSVNSAYGIQVSQSVTGTTEVDASYGIRVFAGSGSGTIDGAYGIFAANPGFGSSYKVAIYADNLSVGYTGTSPPSSGAIFRGNVGIGQSSASYPLVVNGILQIPTAGGTTFSGTTPGIDLFNIQGSYRIGFDSVGGTKGYTRYNIVYGGTSNTWGHVFSLSSAPNGTYTNILFVGGSGNVGVNDVAPASTLSVVGNAQIGFSSGQTSATNGLNVKGPVGFGTAITSGTNGTFATAPPSSNTVTTAFGSSLTAGTSVQNTTGYDIVLNIVVTVTTSTTATITLGVGSSSTPTTNTAVPSFTVASATAYSLVAYVPNSYYVLVGTTGTITVGSITVVAQGV